eukprot:810909-Ditylum_brightwellii.AAC.1
MARGTCNYPHSPWASLYAHDKRVWSTYVRTTPGLDIVDGIILTTNGTPHQMQQPHPTKTPLRDPLREPMGEACTAHYFLWTDKEMLSGYPL